MNTSDHILQQNSIYVTQKPESIAQLIKKSQTVLLHVSNVFPFDICPDSIVIDENKVSIIHKEILGIEHVHSILFEDISDISVYTGIIFATLCVTDSNNPRFPKVFSLTFLKKKDALQARRIIQGMLEIRREGILLNQESTKKTTRQLEQLGEAQGE